MIIDIRPEDNWCYFVMFYARYDIDHACKMILKIIFGKSFYTMCYGRSDFNCSCISIVHVLAWSRAIFITPDRFYTQLIIIVLPRHCFRPHCRMKQTSQRKHASIFLDKIDCIYEWHSLYSCVVQKRFHQIAFIWNSYKMKRSLSSHLSFCLTMGSLGGDSSCILLSADTFNDWSNIIILLINNICRSYNNLSLLKPYRTT